MNKVMSLHDAVAQYVQSGDTICFGGFTTNRKPPMPQWPRSCVRARRTSPSGPARWRRLGHDDRSNSGYTNVSRRFRAAIEAGKLTYEDYSQDVLMLQLHAASWVCPTCPFV